MQPSSYQIFEHPVNQVFRDHNGYRILWTNSNRQVQEKKYFIYTYMLQDQIPFPDIPEIDSFTGLSAKGDHIKIYKDPGLEQGYARGVEFEVESEYPLTGSRRKLQYLEIHLPLEARLSPGTEVYGNPKSPTHDIMSEIQ